MDKQEAKVLVLMDGCGKVLSSDPVRITAKQTYSRLDCRTSLLSHSKIPVLKKPLKLTPIQGCSAEKKYSLNETKLSASLRRQRYQQSRYPVKNDSRPNFQLFSIFPLKPADPISFGRVPQPKLLPSIPLNKRLFTIETLPLLQKDKVPIYRPVSSRVSVTDTLPNSSINKKSAYTDFIPPISKSNTSAAICQSLKKKKKELLGEFTHFPTIYNIPSFKTSKQVGSSVPVLPKILTVPAVPPNSISSSVEQETIPLNLTFEKVPNFSERQKDSIDNYFTAAASSDVHEHAQNVSIIVETVDVGNNNTSTSQVEGVISPSNDIVKTLMDLAELRKEAFARLLDEHAEIVKKIKKAESGNL